MEIIDCHQHIGHAAALDGRMALGATEREAADRVRLLDDAGIDWAIVQPSQMHLRPRGLPDTVAVNDAIAAVQTCARSRFPVAVGTIDPLSGGSGVTEARRCMDELGLSGLSWHHRFQGCAIDTPLMEPLLRELDDRNGLAVIHVNSTSKLEAAWRLVTWARRFPSLRILALDGFFAWEDAEHVLELSEQAPNVMWDLGGPLGEWRPSWRRIATWLSQHGADHFAFSGDIPYGTEGTAKPSRLVENILESNLCDDAKAALLGGNARRFVTHILNGI